VIILILIHLPIIFIRVQAVQQLQVVALLRRQQQMPVVLHRLLLHLLRQKAHLLSIGIDKDITRESVKVARQM